MKRNIFALILTAALIMTMLGGCSAKGGSQTASPDAVSGGDVSSADVVSESDWRADLTEEDMPLVQVIVSSTDAFNAGNIEAYMATIDPASDVYEDTLHTIETIFDKYSLVAEIDSIRVLSRSESKAVVEVTQTTVREGEGKPFYKTQAVMEHTMVCRGGVWYISETLVKSSTELTAEAWDLLEEFSESVSSADAVG